MWISIHDTADFFFYPLTFVAYQSSPKLFKAWLIHEFRKGIITHVWYMSLCSDFIVTDITSCDNSNGANKTYVFLAFTKLLEKEWRAKTFDENYLPQLFSLDFNLTARKLGRRCASLTWITWISCNTYITCITCITCFTCTTEISHQLQGVS